MNKIETPAYSVLSVTDDIEERQYQAMIVAEVIEHGERKHALKHGFKKLANYIFSNNIAMTAPVMQSQTDGAWVISFIMPKKYNLSELPEQAGIRLVQVSEQRLFAISFSGMNSDINISKYEQRIRQQLNDNSKQAIYAYYNPPWILPFLRKNEILLASK